MPQSKFALVFVIVLIAALLTVSGGLVLSGWGDLTGFDYRTLAPFFVLVWLVTRLVARRRQ